MTAASAHNVSEPTSQAAEPRPVHARKSLLGAWLGLGIGLALFTLTQGVVLDRSRENFAEALQSVGLLMLPIVILSLFVQAARQDWKQTEAVASGERVPTSSSHQADHYWFSAGLTLAGVLVLTVTLAGLRILPPMVPPARPVLNDQVLPDDPPPPRQYRPFDRIGIPRPGDED